MRAKLYYTIHGYEVWTVSPLTGDKKDCLVVGVSKVPALNVLRKHNKALDTAVSSDILTA